MSGSMCEERQKGGEGVLESIREQQEYLREMARRLRELAATEENEQKRRLWADHNDLKPRRGVPIWVCPDDDGGWLELIPPESMRCSDAELRDLEFILRKYLYQAEYLKDDFVFEPRVYFSLPGEYTGILYGPRPQTRAWGIPFVKKKASASAYHLDTYLKDEADFETLISHEVDFIPDFEERDRLRDKYEEALDGILSVEFQIPYSVLVQSHLIELVHLRGLEALMYDLYDNEELLLRALRHMGESKARLLDKLEREHLLFDNRINIYTGSGSLGYTNAPRKKDEDVLLSDMWGFADAQEFSSVSSEMFERFALENQAIGLNKFGMGCYGCCEPLDNKYDAIFRLLPRLRRLSVSPWSDVPLAAERIGRKAIFSWKPNPARICTGFDEEEIQKWLREVASCTRDCQVEVILKDIRTCGGTPEHLMRFIRLARQAFNEV